MDNKNALLDSANNTLNLKKQLSQQDNHSETDQNPNKRNKNKLQEEGVISLNDNNSNLLNSNVNFKNFQALNKVYDQEDKINNKSDINNHDFNSGRPDREGFIKSESKLFVVSGSERSREIMKNVEEKLENKVVVVQNALLDDPEEEEEDNKLLELTEKKKTEYFKLNKAVSKIDELEVEEDEEMRKGIQRALNQVNVDNNVNSLNNLIQFKSNNDNFSSKNLKDAKDSDKKNNNLLDNKADDLNLEDNKDHQDNNDSVVRKNLMLIKDNKDNLVS